MKALYFFIILFAVSGCVIYLGKFWNRIFETDTEVGKRISVRVTSTLVIGLIIFGLIRQVVRENGFTIGTIILILFLLIVAVLALRQVY